MEKVLNQLLEKLQKTYAERLVSVVLYGSAVTGEHHAGFSDYNILCVLSELTPRELEAGTDVFRWWREQGSPSPLLLTEQEVGKSCDCFAIEFHDIQDHHQVLFGKDVVATLVVKDTFYRAQVEHDLRAKLLRLRQKAPGMFSDTNLLRRLLLDSVSTFCVLFRHALKLQGVDSGAKKREVIRMSQERFGIDPSPFERLLDVREERMRPRDLDPIEILAPYLKGIDTVIDAVDRLER